MKSPNLKETVNTLGSLDKTFLESSPRTIAEVYVAAIGLLALLKKDQATLQQTRKDSDGNPSCPAPDQIPAISAVLGDARLFGTLINCLSAGNTVENPVGPGENVQVGRKRTLSVSGESTSQNKSFKLTASPVPPRKATMIMDMKSHTKKPSFELPVLAATILFAAFSHLDHWPVQLIDAYAADCFGSRAWVDEESCSLLVQNLSLMHKPVDEPPSSPDPELLSNASAVASAYRLFNTLDEQKNPPMSSFQHVERSASIESLDPAARAHIPYENETFTVLEPEEEQEEPIVSATPETLPQKRKNGKSSGDSSSSSGGEDEQVVATSESVHGESSSEKPKKRRKKSPVKSTNGTGAPEMVRGEDGCYPLRQAKLNLQLVRQRYFGENLTMGYGAVHRALLDRLDQKSRQNSGLLQALPQFTAVPAVRSVVAENLARWLQSPALAGLARKLFAEMVDKIKNVDPPLEEDLRVIDSILGMKLKANQFSAHMENLTAVATKIPTGTVAQHIFLTLIREYLASDSDQIQGGSGDLLKMLGGVHGALPPNISNDAFAAALLTLLAEGEDLTSHSSTDNAKTTRERTVFKLRQVIRTLAASSRGSFDTLRLMEALLSFDVDNHKWSVKNEEDKARLMFQCVTLHVSAASSGLSKTTKGMDETQKRKTIRRTLHEARKSLLGWCCSDYGPRWSASRKPKRENEDCLKAGAGVPDYQSAIGSMSGEESIPTWLNTMRCLLFIEEANSDLMTSFLAPSQTAVGDASASAEEQTRIKACCAYGADIDDDMIRIVLRAFGSKKESLPAEMAIQLLEHLFESCGRSRGTSLRVSDPELVWELYKLAQYIPPDNLLSGKKIEDVCGDEGLPRLAYPGLWWRATMLGLVMCGASPDKIGEVVWKEHPTLRSLMKMLTAGRYRFPTVDCDDAAKEAMKRSEHDARDTENRIAEYLFLPPKKKKDLKNGKGVGSRVSRRLLKLQEEKEAAAMLAENSKRKKMLKSAQKSIMLWDPDGPARKPPRESADLLLSVEKMFGLSDAFQRCTSPDFLLLTIGQTTRGAIERAYDWLIPIISRLPELISRLPSSTSCFLLLRAYGSDTGEKSQLKTLSSPLLFHVKESLRGKYGEEDCIRAFELLMADVASHNADRRKSARRVLKDALGVIDYSAVGESSKPCSWMHNVLLVDHSKSLVNSAIKYMSKAATFERGSVLKSLILALKEHLGFAADHEIKTEVSFPVLFTRLISQRPSVYAEAIDSFSGLRELAVQVVYTEIKKLGNGWGKDEAKEDYAKIWLDLDGDVIEAGVSLELLQSSCVLLSILNVELEEEGKAGSEIVRILLMPSEQSHGNSTPGLAGAKYPNSNDLAITVESWIMLCKARNESIGKKAALSAPEEFLARLLMSSGLPRASLLAMVDRLGELGDKTDDKDSVYRKLMNPSTSSEWDLGRIGKYRDIIRKLIGRLSAYFRVGTIDEKISTSFLEWLMKESKMHEKPTKVKKKKGKGPGKPIITMKGVPGMFGMIVGPLVAGGDSGALDGESLPDVSFFESTALQEKESKEEVASDIATSIKQYLSNHDPHGLDAILLDCLCAHGAKPKSGFVAVTLIECVEADAEKHQWKTDRILKWVPTLSKHECTPELREILFRVSEKSNFPKTLRVDTLKRCMLVWSCVTMSECLDWILTRDENELASYSTQRLILFLSAALNSDARQSRFKSLPEQKSRVACSIALRGLEDFPPDQHDSRQRSNVPDSLRLVLSLAEPTKKHFLLAGGMILQRIGQLSNPNSQSLFGEAFLRLYLLHPQWANTGTSQVRTVLLKSAELNEENWSGWISSLDDQFDDLLASLSSGDVRVIKAFSEHSRKHPLLVFRKSRSFLDMLDHDARASKGGASTLKVNGETVAEPAEAVLYGRKVRVKIRHWGYEFSEPLWMGVLEIFCTIPKEVLYFSGAKLGFWSILDFVLNLLQVQLHLTSADATSKLKAKLGEIVKTYRGVNSAGYNQWLSNVVEGTGREVRNCLVSLSLLSPQEAIDNLKAANNAG